LERHLAGGELEEEAEIPVVMLTLAFAVVLWDCVAVNLDWCAKYCGKTVPDPRLFCQFATSGLFKARVA
jgi:hypothetical protein